MIIFLISQPKHMLWVLKRKTVLLSTQNTCLNWPIRKYSYFYYQKFCLSWPMMMISLYVSLQHALPILGFRLFFLFLNQNICCGYSKEPSQWEHPKHMLKLVDKNIFMFFYDQKFCLSWPMIDYGKFFCLFTACTTYPWVSTGWLRYIQACCSFQSVR